MLFICISCVSYSILFVLSNLIRHISIIFLSNLSPEFPNGTKINPESPTEVPATQLRNDTDATRTACEEITSLIAGGGSGNAPPAGGWMPTSQGWRKGTGNIECGWGSTYSGVDPTVDYSLADFGRVVYESDVSNEIECCMKAMEYDGVDIKHGGAAIRFDYFNGQCRLDRELMMRGNLDSSGGRPMHNLDACGENGLDEDGTANGKPIDYFYWRPAAGAADAANLQSAGKCVAQHDFTRLIDSDNINRPLGRLPDGLEIPNHLDICKDSNREPEACYEALRYNAINTAEGCCEACAELRWLPTEGTSTQITPCVAFQIVDGKCRILRERWFTQRYGKANMGNSEAGNQVMSVTATIEACAREQESCSRRDNSHGHWANCNPSDTGNVPQVQEDCNYYSHMYYRDPNGNNLPPVDTSGNTTFRKIQVITLTNSSTGNLLDSLNVTANSTIVDDRMKKRGIIVQAPTPPTGYQDTDTVSKGYEHEHSMSTGKENANDENVICSRIALYLLTPQTMSRDFHTNRVTFNRESTVRHLHASNQCCRSSVQRGIDAVDVHASCEMSMKITQDFIRQVEKKATDRRRRLGQPKPKTAQQYILAWECIGRGKDLCDVAEGGSTASSLDSIIVADADIKAEVSSKTQKNVMNETLVPKGNDEKRKKMSPFLIVAMVIAGLVIVGMFAVVAVKMHRPNAHLTHTGSFSGLHGRPKSSARMNNTSGNGMLRKDSLSANALQQNQVVEMPIVHNPWKSAGTPVSTIFGRGTVIKTRQDGIQAIQLDWKLAGGSRAILYRPK